MQAPEDLADRDACLVYGDWLMEHGDPHGDLIAVQAAREDPAGGVDADLAAREDALLAAHAARWLGPGYEPWLAGELEVTWARGFVRAARVRPVRPGSPTEPLALVRALLALPLARPLVRLDVECASFGLDARELRDAVARGAGPALATVGTGKDPARPAVLELAAVPRGGVVLGVAVGARIPLPRDRWFAIGRSPDCDLRCDAPLLGGRRNSMLELRERGWTWQHLGHSQPIAINGRATMGTAFACDGDVLEPAPGLRLRLSIAGDPPVWSVAWPRA